MIVNQNCLWMTGGRTKNGVVNDLWAFELGEQLYL